MTRLIALVGAALAAGVVAVTAVAAPDDVKGPGCVDVINGSFIYNADGTVTGNVTVDASACKQATYTLYVLEESGDPTPLATDEGEANNPFAPDRVFFGTEPLTTNDNDVCIYVEARIGGHVFDRAPDSGCEGLIKEGSPGGGGMN